MPIVRAADGLALSSRNGYLSDEHRQVAPVIYQSLKQAEQQLHQGKDLQQVVEDIKTQLTDNGFVVDYVEARQTNLLPATQFDRDIVLFVAAKLGATRLIDNLEVAFTPQ
ncbi:Pantothenate synthetase [compost metagenome]